MAPLVRYQFALLATSQRWLAPVLLYAAFVAVGVQGGQPVLDSLGYGAAALLPVAAWLARLCVSNEPPAARHCVAAATSPSRAHLAALLTAFGCAAGLGAVATAFVVLVSRWADTEGHVRINPLTAAGAGLLAVLVCALLGTAVGALGSRPVLHGTGWGLALTATGVLLALVTAGSPARAAVTALVGGSRTGAVSLPLVPFGAAVLLAAAVGAVVCGLSARRG
ncbi:ABC transporter [Streptomyces sp. NBC_00237]|uniref:ABC transporter n=1 Tax=Streptomyces sp. NBC_00237 TaxID=2975687 RepID=UPI0022564BC0|nr:ABC transporter [Streptomyces sp. NBC_00237]MCX5203498.1 ABC transporter [Streptomyces sp. NBC_00237]